MKFAEDSLLQSEPIEVNAENGVVTLSGFAENATLEKQAVQLSWQAHGVVRVISEIRTPDVREGGKL